MKISKSIIIGVSILILLIVCGLSYYFISGHQTDLSEIAENVEFSVNEGSQGGYILIIANNSLSDLSSCSIEVFNKNRFEEDSKSIFIKNNFSINKKSNSEIKINVDFRKDQYLCFQGYRGLSLKRNKITIESEVSVLNTSLEK